MAVKRRSPLGPESLEGDFYKPLSILSSPFSCTPEHALQKALENPIRFVPATHLTFEDEASMAPVLRPRKHLNESPAQQANRMNVQNISSSWGTQQDRPHLSRGFPNWTGSICYLSSVLQALLHIPKFVNWLELEHKICTAVPAGRKSCVACALKALSASYWDSRINQKSVEKSVKEVFRTLCAAGWIDEGEHDAHDLYLRLIGILRTELPSATAVIRALFETTQSDTLICPACNNQSPTIATSPSIGVTFDNVAPLAKLLRSEAMFGTSFNPSSPCNACTMKPGRQVRKRIITSPEILVMQIRRFSYDKNYNGRIVHGHIPFAECLDLSAFNNGPSTLRYRLVAVVSHKGSLGSGHYITVARGPSGHWEEMNDSSVKIVRLKDALRPRTPFSSYLLFYERVGGEVVEASTRAYDPEFWEDEDRKRDLAKIRRTKKESDTHGVLQKPQFRRKPRKGRR